MNAPPRINCAKCGDDIRKYESYSLAYKLSGQERPIRIDYCSVCWAEFKYQKIVEQIILTDPDKRGKCVDR